MLAFLGFWKKGTVPYGFDVSPNIASTEVQFVSSTVFMGC
jgi:hypothetical protein